MGSFFLLCDIYFDLVEKSDITTRGGQRWDLGKAESSIIITIIKLFYTYFSWYIAYYENVFLL